MRQDIIFNREKKNTSAQRPQSLKLLTFPLMQGPVRDPWVLTGIDSGQQAGFLLLFACRCVWETGIHAYLASKQVSCCEETPNSSAIIFFPPHWDSLPDFEV